MTVDSNNMLSTASLDSLLASCRKVELPCYGFNPLLHEGGVPVVAATEAYKSLRTRLMSAADSKGISSLVLTSTCHAEGKTLTAANLAYCCAQLEDSPILLVDGDLRTIGLTDLLGVREFQGLREILSSALPYEQAILATDVPNLYILGAGFGSARPTELFSGAAWKQFLNWAKQIFRLVIVDVPPAGVVADFNLIEAGCDGVLVIVRAHQTRDSELQECISRVAAEKLVGVVWNDADSAPEAYAYYYRKAKEAAAG